jgi:O-6-methylguanine DNA methyltransferase
MDAVYGARDRARGVPATVAWIAEEVGELARSVRKGTRDEQLHELGDTLAWLASLANQLELSLDIQATAFQWQVWQALGSIPYGETRSYADVAAAIGRPRAVRAVARACAANPVALAIPCHRVVRSAGGVGGYRWGAARKKALLARERGR